MERRRFSQTMAPNGKLLLLSFTKCHGVFSYIQSPSQPYNAPPIPRPVSPFFCKLSLLTGFHFPHVQFIDNLCGIFLDDISTPEQFAFLVYCYRVIAIFHNALCFAGVCVWPNK